MKHLFTSIFLIIFMSSCEKEEPIKFEGRMDAEFVIPLGINTVETHYITVRDIPTFFLQNAENFKLDTSNIRNIQASKGSLKAKFNDAEFDFIERISVWAVSRSNPNLKREMYYLDFNPLDTREELRMLSSTSQLYEIIREQSIDLEIRLNLRRFPTSNIKTIIDFGYAVK
ncbi:MAG: hypothetical protein IPN86_03075 [Saprospiraceae bacterium]|nr:hypothetical protein [Saprospiraceae bacterium]